MRDFEAWCPDMGEESKDSVAIEASDEKRAAEMWAEWDDSGNNYFIAGGSSVTVMVRDVENRALYRFLVVGQICYRATDISVFGDS
jgi:hypothetical protein